MENQFDYNHIYHQLRMECVRLQNQINSTKRLRNSSHNIENNLLKLKKELAELKKEFLDQELQFRLNNK